MEGSSARSGLSFPLGKVCLGAIVFQSISNKKWLRVHLKVGNDSRKRGWPNSGWILFRHYEGEKVGNEGLPSSVEHFYLVSVDYAESDKGAFKTN